MTLNEALQELAQGVPSHAVVALSAIMVLAGFVSGLIGFGFSFIGALGLFAFAPRELFPVLLLLSIVTQVVSIWSLRDSMVPFRRWWSAGPLPFIVGGALGVPIGSWLLFNLDALALCELAGVLIVAYAAWSLLDRPKSIPVLLALPARAATGVVGGVVGGFTAAPGSVVAIWGTLTGIAKTQQRAIVQPFILCTQLVALADLIRVPSGLPPAVLAYSAGLALLVVPANLFGVRVFRRISDATFKRFVLVLLIGMGIALIDRGFHVWGELFTSWHARHPSFDRT